MKKVIPILIVILLCASSAYAEVVGESVTYEHDGTVLQGYVAYDNSISGKRPGVVVIHQWMGLTDYEKMRADMLAELGYIAFAADIYGVKERPSDRDGAKVMSSKFSKDRKLMRARASAAYSQLMKHKLADTGKAAVMGYCFGGTVALELARSGEDLLGTVTFHGGLSTPTPEDAGNINGKVLVLHGAADKVVPPEQVAAFQAEMSSAKVDWYMVTYAYARHAFTHKGPRYNEPAERRSWEEMRDFLEEIFK